MATRWGIVSAGKISHDFTTCLRSMPQDEQNVVAVAARHLECAQKFAELHKIPKAYGSYEELAQDPDVEVVYIGTINKYHFSVAKMMIEAGKHLLVEKPLTLNLKCTQELLRLAREKKIFFMEALWSRFLPAYEFLKKEISSGTLGEILYVNATFGLPIEDDRVRKKEMGGGSILDFGIYAVNLVSMVYGDKKPTKIAAVGHLNKDGVDESFAASLQYENGKVATISAATCVRLPCEAHIVGTKGTSKLPFPMWGPTQVIVHETFHNFPLPSTVLPCNFPTSSGLRYEAMEVRRCLKEGLLESQQMSHADSELLASVMDELRRQIGVVYPEDSEVPYVLNRLPCHMSSLPLKVISRERNLIFYYAAQ